ncbi:MAG TPA: transcriptional regulator, partial [Actinomycetota bacterium]|nr:transcriptional regulator [Actinomycetota bacterium]
GAHGRDHAGDVIFVGGEPKSVARLGYRAAGSFRDALEMAKDTVGSSPSITYFHAPPIMIADVV